MRESSGNNEIARAMFARRKTLICELAICFSIYSQLLRTGFHSHITASL